MNPWLCNWIAAPCSRLPLQWTANHRSSGDRSRLAALGVWSQAGEFAKPCLPGSLAVPRSLLTGALRKNKVAPQIVFEPKARALVSIYHNRKLLQP